MIDRDDRSRRRWLLAGGGLLLLGVTLAWGVYAMSPRSPDDPRELLRHASTSQPPAPAKIVGKPMIVEAESSSGATVRAQFRQVEEKGGRGGFVAHFNEPIKEGDTVTLKMPGGGSIVVARPKDGKVPPLPGAAPR